MNNLLDEAIDTVRSLPASEQNEIARVILRLAGYAGEQAVPICPDQQAAINRSRDAAALGDFASDAEVAAVWAKHGL